MIAKLRIGMLLLCLGLMIGCTQNQRAKNFGGTETIDLPAGEKLVNITWKDENLWYLTRTMQDDEQAEAYSFHQKSSFGILEGTVKIKESKSKSKSEK